MSTKEVALVVIDVQQGFITDRTRHALPAIHRIVTSGSYGLVVATRFANPECGVLRKQLSWHHLEKDEETQLDPVVQSAADLVIDKNTYGAAGEIGEAVRAHGIERVELIGFDTNACVLANALGLVDLGIQVCVNPDACASTSGHIAHRAGMIALRHGLGSLNVEPRD